MCPSTQQEHLCHFSRWGWDLTSGAYTIHRSLAWRQAGKGGTSRRKAPVEGRAGPQRSSMVFMCPLEQLPALMRFLVLQNLHL